MQLTKSPLFFTTLISIILLSFISSIKAEPYEGYTLFNPTNARTTYLIDMDGRNVHTWNNNRNGGYAVYLLENGNLLRPGQVNNPSLRGGAYAGLIQEIDWDADVVWEFEYSSATYITHHDLEILPNGNVMAIAWEVKSTAEARQAGFNRNALLWPDHIIEVEPDGDGGAEIVWEWHAWDHLIQDYNQNSDNYGVIADHPELLDINMAGRDGGPGPGGGDWLHINGISYNPDLDQIVISSHFADEFYIIDHSTTTEEAASHEGGNSGIGGDILYRWGNPGNYDADGEQYFDVLHCSWWIPQGLPGAGNILAFNNGEGQRQSVVVEIIPPVDDEGHYELEEGEAFGPDEPVWTYSDGRDFYSNHLGGCQRLPNGNTLISESTSGHLFEVNRDGDIEWEHTVNRSQIARSLRYAVDYPGLYSLHPLDEGDVVINEFLVVNDTTQADQDDEFDSWIELYNNSDEELSLWGFRIGINDNFETSWIIPDTSIDGHDYLIIWTDEDMEQEGLHADFQLPSRGGNLYFTAPDGNTLDEIEFGDQMADRSYGRYPNGTGEFTEMVPSFGSENEDEEIHDYSGLVINEILIINDTTQVDQDNEFDSWIELFNNSDESISLASVSFCIETIMPEENWLFPDTSIASHGYLIVWADGDVDQAGLHTDFSLSGFEGELLLFDYGNEDIDRVEWYEQTTDISLGRYPNGTGEFRQMTPSFASENLEGVQSTEEIHYDSPDRFKLFESYPNPFNSMTTITYQLPRMGQVTLSVYDVNGKLVTTLFDGVQSVGSHQVVLNADAVPSGVYLISLSNDQVTQTCKVLLIQ
ncbi:MAG: aryl-sulfate sulfotransferase [Candidatus Hatepunaea meridiana]|nr:aryl-sulfate sulfotransferase [Candidatus Hatepunaea meridiana]